MSALLTSDQCCSPCAAGVVEVVIGSDCCNLSGSGSPEGVVLANVGWRYWDYTNGIDYVKNSGNGTTTGWQALGGLGS